MAPGGSECFRIGPITRAGGLSQRAEGGSYLVHERRRLLERGEVAAPFRLVPVAQIRELALRARV